MKRKIWSLILTVLLAGSVFAASSTPKAKMPVLTTSAGQSPDVETLNIVMEEAGLGYDYCDVPTAASIASGVGLGGKESGPGFHVEIKTDTTHFPKGTAYKTIIFAIGASLKGMGASGLTLESEEARLKELIDFCKKNKIFIIAVHIGGESKRGAPKSDNERMIDAVAPLADFLIVTKDSNKDGRFTTLAKSHNISLSEVDFALGLVEILKNVFSE